MPDGGEERVSMEMTDEVLRSMEVGMAFRDYNGRISSMDFHRASNYLVTASDDESIRLYDVANATCLKTINSKKYGVDLVCFTSHPTTVIYSSKNGWDESLRLLSLHDNKYLRYFKGHHDRVVSLSLCPRKDCFISGSFDRTVLLWDQRAEKCQGLLRVQGRPAVAYDDQGMVFAIAFGGYVRMFDARKFEKGPFDIFSAGGDFSEANVVKFSNDGRLMLLTTTEGHIHVLDSFRGTTITSYSVKPVVNNATLEASFSPDGMFVVSGSGDGSVYAWSVRTGKEVSSWLSTETEPPVIKWAPGNLMFVTGSSELSFWIPDLSKIGAYVVGANADPYGAMILEDLVSSYVRGGNHILPRGIVLVVSHRSPYLIRHTAPLKPSAWDIQAIEQPCLTALYCRPLTENLGQTAK